MHKVKLNILGLSFSQTQDNAYVLILVEEEGERRIPIIIGGTEAQAIAIELENMKAPRPLTHDLFRSLAFEFEISLEEVIIYKLQEGIFYSKIVVKQNEKTVEIDSRTSDAVALAVRFNSPIYTTSDVILRAGIVLDMERKHQEENQKTDTEPAEVQNSLAFESDEELKTMLNQAIESEDYEKASKIRDEIKRRSEMQ